VTTAGNAAKPRADDAAAKDFGCKAARLRKQARTEESKETKRVNMALAEYTPQPHKFKPLQ